MAMKALTSQQKQALAALRESKGGISEEKRAQQKQRISARKAIKKFLQAEPASVPQIAAAVGIPADEAMWQIAGMRKYGMVSETGEDGDYVLYALVATEEKAVAH